jgi:hypothetical protein
MRLVYVLALCALPAAHAAAQDVDLLTFAAGAIPLEVRGPGAELGAGFEEAIEAIDGN